MATWTEVTDENEIGKYNRQLAQLLRRGTKAIGEVRIGYPRGSFDATVRVSQSSTGQHIWTYSGNHEDTDDFITLIGRYEPGQRAHFLMDLQFNFHNGGFSRKKGGAFVKDDQGRVYLGHRGIVTKGQSRVQKASLLAFLGWPKYVTAQSAVRPGQAEVLVVAALDDPKFTSKVVEFAHAVRDAAILAASQAVPAKRTSKAAPTTPPASKKKVRSPKARSLDLQLSEYCDEFSGKRTVNRKNQVVVEWKHGKVIKALRVALDGRGQILKCQAADLVLQHGKYLDLFEAKSSSTSQSIYTAIGQLVFNGFALQDLFKSYTVRTFLVLPESADNALRHEHCKKLGFNLVTFKPSGDNYQFSDLPLR